MTMDDLPGDEVRAANSDELALVNAFIEAGRKLALRRLQEPDFLEHKRAVDEGKATFTFELQFPSRGIRGWIHWPEVFGADPREMFLIVPDKRAGSLERH